MTFSAGGRLRRAGVVTVLILTAAVLSACGGAGGGGLVEATLPGSGYCTPPVPRWNSPMGFTSDWYANQGLGPAVIVSLRLISPHGLVLHGALVYEMRHDLHTLYIANPWPKVGFGAPADLWAQRQPIPGAVIPPGHSKYALIKFSTQNNIYVIAEDVTATTPRGGWALGEVVTYRSGRGTWTVEAHTGIAIGTAGPQADSCGAPFNAMDNALQHLTSPS
jgi:hypothetical protein